MGSPQLSHKQRSNFKRRDDALGRYNSNFSSSGYQGSNWQGGWGHRGNTTNNHYDIEGVMNTTVEEGITTTVETGITTTGMTTMVETGITTTVIESGQSE